MLQTYKKEEVIHIENVPARVIHQILDKEECYCPLHWHEDIEIDLFLFNNAVFTVNGRSEICQPGDFLIINSGDIHAGKGDYLSPEAQRHQELLTIQFDYDYLRRYYPGNSALRFKNELDPEIYEQIRAILIRIGTLYLQKPAVYELKLTALLLELGALLLEYCAETDEKALKLQENKTFRQVKSTVEYIEAHYMEDLTLEGVADRQGWVPTYFSRKFRQMTGITYHDYLSSVRLKHAADDLLLTEAGITQIALENGFPNVKSFITVFKKTFACTPQKYRNYQKTLGREKREPGPANQ